MRLALLTTALVVFAGSLMAAPKDSTPVTHGELGGLVRQYLLDHPEVIVDALEVMQRQENEKSSLKAADAVQKNRKQVYNDPLTPIVGKADALLTIVEFSDYNCSACKFMFTALDRLMKEDGDKVRLLVKEFPIFGEASEQMAAIGIAAYQIDKPKYQAFHSALMKAAGRTDDAKVDAALTFAGYNASEVRERAKQKDIAKAIEQNHALGQAMGIRGTPTLIIGDEVVPHALDYDTLKEKVEAQNK
ncbi:MAG: DsbA family protein [Rickettsiales bacterium]|nr:DsbA family protein [Rickettsiales bacterium]